jgi:hypothetical protein
VIWRLIHRLFPRRRWGAFWCNRHWAFLSTHSEIDKDVAALGITIAMETKGMPKTANACCAIPEPLLEGIFERSKNWQR